MLNHFANSVVVRKSAFSVNNHSTANHLYGLYGKDSFTVHKGMIWLWNRMKLANTPLLNDTEIKNNVMFVNGAEGKWRFGIEYDLGLPTIAEDATGDNPVPGIAASEFLLRLNTNCFNAGDTISYDPRDGVDLFIIDEGVETASYTEYRVKLTQGSTNPDLFFPKDKLSPGTEFMKLSNANGEFDFFKSGISHRKGMMELESQIGGSRSVYHEITEHADMLSVDNDNIAYNWLNQYGAKNNPNFAINLFNTNKEGKTVPGSGRWIRMIEALLRAELMVMEDRDLFWSKGGIIQGVSRKPIRINTGLYPQMRNGNQQDYSRLTLSLIETNLERLYYRSGIPIENRKTKIRVGTAALVEISRLLADDFSRSFPFSTNNMDALKGAIYGDSAMNLGYGFRFTSKRFPVGGEVEFEYYPAFDNTYNQTRDGLINGFPKESHTLAIFDVTDGTKTNVADKLKNNNIQQAPGFNSTANIFLVKPKNWDKEYWFVHEGITGYDGTPSGSMHKTGGMGLKPGFGIGGRSYSSIYLADPTRTVLLEKSF